MDKMVAQIVQRWEGIGKETSCLCSNTWTVNAIPNFLLYMKAGILDVPTISDPIFQFSLLSPV